MPRIPGFKSTIVDLRCTDKQGRLFIVEMQIQWTTGFMQQMLFNASKAYIKQLNAGEEYHLLKPVYGLALLASEFDPNPNDWYHHYKIVNVQKPASELLAVPELKEAVSITEQAAYSPAELDAYDRFWDVVSTEKTLKAGAYAEGKDMRSAGIAIKMLKDNELLDKISRFTGLSQDDIVKLKNKL